ncbi:MAG: hypothetical protein ABSH46_19725 [Bryobacteraceae bacterium]|jgi:hypothetical protein
MKSKLLVLGLLAGSSLFAGTRVFVGVGGYGPPPVVAYATPCPGPGYSWVGGFWDYSGPRRFWRAGYWAPPRFVRPFRAEPHYYGRGRDFRGRR